MVQITVISIVSVLIYVFFQFLYFTPMRDSQYVYLVGMGCSLVTTICWLRITKILHDRDQIYLAGIYWDTGLVAISCIMPLLMFGIKLNQWGYLGIAMIIGGLVILHKQFHP